MIPVTQNPTPPPTKTPDVTISSKLPSKSTKVGDVVHFGKYHQDINVSNGKENIEWLVLAKENNRILVISQYVLDCKAYNPGVSNITWEKSSIRKWLNESFFNEAFSDAEKSMIPTVTVEAEDNPVYGTDAGNNTHDNVFLLSISEANNYLTQSERSCSATNYAKAGESSWGGSSGIASWWTRSPGNKQQFAAYALGGVSREGRGTHHCEGIRPALWIEINSNTGNSADDKNENMPAKPAKSPSTSTQIGDVIKYGKYEQDNNLTNGKEDIEWIVLAKENERIFVISKYIIDYKQYHDTKEFVTWEYCTLRSWLNDTFISNAFSNAEQSRIPTVNVKADHNNEYNTHAGNNTNDKLFLLGISEVNEYFGTGGAVMCSLTSYASTQSNIEIPVGFAGQWWLRSPGYSRRHAIPIYVDVDCVYDGWHVDDEAGIRPAMWIDLKA